MVKIEQILDNVFNRIDIYAGSLYNDQGVFFIISDHDYVRIRPLVPANHSPIKSKELLEKLLTDQDPSVSKIEFDFAWNQQLSIPLTIGIFREDLQGDFSTELAEQTWLEAYLNGLKQAILIALQMEKENHQQMQVFDITKKLYSSIEVNQVLEVLYDSLVKMYPHGEVQIWLSHDYETTIPVKKLSIIGNEQDHNIRAFLNGVPYTYPLASDPIQLATSIPLKGKQGTYGVIQYMYQSEQKMDERDLEQISLIADATGIALETAILYQQSQRLISQLRLINETAQLLNKTLNLNENIEHLIAEIKHIFNSEDVYFLAYLTGEQAYQQLDNSEQLSLVGETISIDEYQLIKKVHETKEAVLLPDTHKAELTKHDAVFQELCRSLMIVPMIHNSEMLGILLITHSKPYYFSFDNYRLLQNLVNHASLAIANSRLHEELNKMVITDNLTRLYARSYLDQAIVLSQNQDAKGSFILIDIDNFKAINDTYGHQTGDDVLIQVANIIKSSIRDNDIAARWGGEELAIYLPNASLDSATKVAERIRMRVSRETSPRVTISIGVSKWEQQDEVKGQDILFQKADKSLYRAKSMGKNQVIVSQNSEDMS